MENKDPSAPFKAYVSSEGLICQICLDIATSPIYCLACFQAATKLTLFCKDCYTQKGLLARNLECKKCKTLNPDNGRVNAKVKEFLKSKQFTCHNFCSNGDSMSYDEFGKHIKNQEGDSAEYEKIDEIKKRIEEIKQNGKWHDILKHDLNDNWDPDNAIGQFGKSLASLDGYIGNICTSVACKWEAEYHSQSENMSIDQEYHPYGLKLCGTGRKFSMVKIDRIPNVYDKMIQFKIPVGHEKFEEGKVADLHYVQMLQHQKVGAGELDPSLDPIKLDRIPFLHEDGKSLTLIDPNSLKLFKNIDFIRETVSVDVEIGPGFKLCLLRDTNQIFIVGGLNTTTSTFLFSPSTNLISLTSFVLTYPRLGHSLCSIGNTLICTGSSISDPTDEFTCRRVEIFKPEFQEWRTVASMNEDRAHHYSVCVDDTVYVVFGESPKYGTKQDGIECIKEKKVVKEGSGWSHVSELFGMKLIESRGFLPYPYDQKFLILGKVQKDDYSSEYDDDDDDPTGYTYDALEIKKAGLKKNIYDYKAHQFDKNNMPCFYTGIYFVFGKDGKTVYKGDRQFSFY